MTGRRSGKAIDRNLPDLILLCIAVFFVCAAAARANPERLRKTPSQIRIKCV